MPEKGESTEQRIRKRFDDDFTIAKKFMEPIHMRMDSDYEMYRNRWKGHKDFRISKFFAYVETIVPFMVNNRVRGTVKAEFPEYTKHAEGMTYILDHTFDANNWDYAAQRIVKMAEIYRYSLAYVGHDAEALNGTGKLCITEVNPRWCYVDPAATELQEGSMFFYSEPMRVTECIKKHPDKAEKIKQSIGKRKDSNITDKTRQWFQTWFRSVTNFLGVNWEEGEAGINRSLGMSEITEEEKRAQSVAYIHYWYRDDKDKWRVSYWADDVFLEDLPNPFNHGQLPYVAYVPTEDILSAVGLPTGEQIDCLNEEFNVLLNEIIHNVRRANDPPSVLNTAYGNIKDRNELTESGRKNGPILVNNPDFVPLTSIFDYLNTPQIASGTFNLKEVFDQIEDQILGTNDTMRGMGQATSGKEVQLKQEAAYTRIKTKLDNWEKFNKAVSEQVIQNGMQFIDTNRPFRVKGDYRKYGNQQDAPFEVKPIQQGMGQDGPEFDKSEFFLYANPNEWTKIMEDQKDEQGNPIPDVGEDGQPLLDDEGNGKIKQKEAYRVLQMVVDIEAGSSLPTSAIARKEDAAELYKAGAIDQQALLEAYEYPQADEIMKRMQEAAQQQAQQQMQAEQAQQQQQAQMEQAKLQQEMQLKQMELGARATEQQMNNQARMQQQPQQPDIASGLDAIRQAVPELAQASDEEIMQLVANMQVS